MDRAKNLARQQALEKLIDDAKAKMTKDFPGVMNVAIGLKRVKGVYTKDIVLVIQVAKKLPPANVPAGQMIPAMLLGEPTDVQEIPSGVPVNDDNRYRPLIGGCQITNSLRTLGEDTIGGTLGIVCRYHHKGKKMPAFLTCEHVTNANGGDVGTTMYQPIIQDCCKASNNIGEVAKAHRSTHVDCAIIFLPETMAPTYKYDEVIKIGKIKGVASACVEEPVSKYGRRTELTKGFCVLVHAMLDVGGRMMEDQQVYAEINDPKRYFVDAGDSGSVIVNMNNEVTGLVASGHHKDEYGNDLAGANDIFRVMKRLHISIGSESRVTVTDDPDPLPANLFTKPPHPLLTRYAALLKETPAGTLALNAIQDNIQEVLNLIQNNTAVAGAWKQNNGPDFFKALISSARNPQQPIVTTLGTTTLAMLAAAMGTALSANGSPQLQAALRTYGPMIMNVLPHLSTVDALSKSAGLGPVNPV